ncbi:MAG: hypothetical protein IPM55_24000 [Acidobacteria bacterium]|nr:hypothetical protein [Acidobacteriota bacterium]
MNAAWSQKRNHNQQFKLSGIPSPGRFPGYEEISYWPRYLACLIVALIVGLLKPEDHRASSAR